MSTIAIRFIPIFLILGFGMLLRKTDALPSSFPEVIKALIVKLALPSTLFISFLTMELKASYIGLFVATIIFCFLLYGSGLLVHRFGLIKQRYSQFFFTGFEFGMVGVALFTSLFGQQRLYAMLLLGLGHELFIWFFYVPALQYTHEGSIDPLGILRSFISSPIIVAILSAVVLNTTGLYDSVASLEGIDALLEALRLLAATTSPLILLVIGYQLSIRVGSLSETLRIVGLRYLIVAILGLAFVLITDRWILEVDELMLTAFITFFVLPPPFVIPVFLPPGAKKESVFYNNSLVIYTILTLIVYTLIMIFVL